MGRHQPSLVRRVWVVLAGLVTVSALVAPSAGAAPLPVPGAPGGTTQTLSTGVGSCVVTVERNVDCWGELAGNGQSPLEVAGVGGVGVLANVASLARGATSRARC